MVWPPSLHFFGMSRKLFGERCVTSQETAAKENTDGVASMSKSIPTLMHFLLLFRFVFQ